MDKHTTPPDAMRHANTPQAPPVALWRTKAEICADLEVSARTLNRRVADDKIERRQVGNRALFRVRQIANAAPCATPTRHATSTRHASTSQLALATTPAPSPRTALESAPLFDLVRQLTADVANANAERGEAIGVGFMLAEQRDQAAAERDRLAAQLAELQRALFNLSDTARAWPVRKQLLTALVQSKPLMDTQHLPE